jgi:hypothetical protein
LSTSKYWGAPWCLSIRQNSLMNCSRKDPLYIPIEVTFRWWLICAQTPPFLYSVEIAKSYRMGFGWALAFMRYGESWRRTRALIHKKFHRAAVTQYQPLQIKHTRSERCLLLKLIFITCTGVCCNCSVTLQKGLSIILDMLREQ